MKKGLFITGTNTEIGKTVTSAMLLSAALSQAMDAYYFKPIQTGSDQDCETVKKLSAANHNRIIQPLYRFAQPRAPYCAARAEDTQIDLDLLSQHWQRLPDAHYLVEGAGGLLTPVASNQTIRDIIELMSLPIVIVASTQLGTMNHTLLTIEAALSTGLSIKGIILVGPDDPELPDILFEFSGVSVLCRIPRLSSITDAALQAKAIFSADLLGRLLT